MNFLAFFKTCCICSPGRQKAEPLACGSKFVMPRMGGKAQYQMDVYTLTILIAHRVCWDPGRCESSPPSSLKAAKTL